MGWVGTWTTTPAATDGFAFNDQTLRMIAHVSIGGSKLRVKISNAYGQQRLKIGAATIACRTDDAGINAQTIRMLTFDGETATAIAAGSLAVSDEVELEFGPLSDLAISFYLPDNIPEGFDVTGHATCNQTNYISTPGNHVGARELPVAQSTDTYLFASGIDVEAPDGAGGIVALGDSLTDCNISTVDANNRWPDQLARNILARHETNGGRLYGVMNQGIGGSKIIHDARGGSSLQRFDRDVIAQTGATHLIFQLGINDIRNRGSDPDLVVSADELIAGMKQMAVRAHAKGIKIYAGTLLPYENEDYNPPPGLKGLYTEEGNQRRLAINAWLRQTDVFDAVIDFDKELQNPDHPNEMLPLYDCGDHLHPSDAGYIHMGDIIDLSLFD
ncbi:MAG: SGNH/GDSL hydrolase family protein [Alphaproteobacteria bacterium]|nr:SGNH/GDSL hydrolase family protein [Alphaproteobacteria bacterium]